MTTKDPQGLRLWRHRSTWIEGVRRVPRRRQFAERGTRGQGTTVTHDQGKKCGGACLAAVLR